MDAISRLLATYLVNALWQVAVITLVAALCARMMRRAPSGYKHRLWVAALLLSTLLPLASLGRMAGGHDTALDAAGQSQEEALGPGSNGSAHIFSWLGGRPHRQRLSLAPVLTWILMCGYAVSCSFGLVRLGRSWLLTMRFREACRVRALPGRLARIEERLAVAFGCSHIPILYSAEIAGPVTMGFRRSVLVLPERFFTDISEADFSSAICHELAHIRRHDFALNLVYEMLSLPILLHPATAIIKGRIQRTRELACDEMASAHLANPTAYARALLSIAQSMHAEPSTSASSYALGLFDTDTMEERIMNLLKTNHPAGKRLKTVLAAVASGLLAITAIAVSAFSLQVTKLNNNVDLKPFVGVWTSQFQGKTFVALTIKEESEMLKGTCMHTINMAEDDQGRLTKVDDKQTLDKILDAQVSGTNVVLSIGDGEDPSHVAKFEMRVTGPGAAEMRPVHHAENKITTQWWKLSRSSGSR